MPTRFRWVTVALIVGLIVINYIDRSAISYAVLPLKSEFGISDTQYGIASSVFAIGYAVFAFLSGPVVDRFGTRKVLIATVTLFSLTTVLVPLAGGFAGLVLIRLVLGAAEAPAFPAATRTAGRWLPSSERGFALALVSGVGVSGSLLIAGPLLTQLIGVAGWRGMFWVIGGLGLLWILAALGLLRERPEDAPQANDAERALIAAGQDDESKTPVGRSQTDWHSLFRNRNLWMLSVGYFAWGFMFWAFMYWLPQYLSTSFGLSIKSVGAFAIAPWAAGVVGCLLGGVLVDRVYRRTRSVRSRFTIGGLALLFSGASIIPMMLEPTLVVALVSISCGVGFGFVTGGIWWVASIDAEPTQPATAAGFADSAFAVSGIVAPVVMGYIVQNTGTFTSGFVVMSALTILGALAMLFGPVEPRHRALTTSDEAQPSRS